MLFKTQDEYSELSDPILSHHFWMNPFAMHFSLIKASDMVLVDDHGYVVEGGNQAMINEAGFMIHSEVHRARPDAVAVAHAHSIYGKTWSGFGKPIEMLTQGISYFSVISLMLSSRILIKIRLRCRRVQSVREGRCSCRTWWHSPCAGRRACYCQSIGKD